MRHYEVVFLVHPDQTEEVPAMVERHKASIVQAGGAIHRVEDWGRLQLAYPIKKVMKAHYILMNIECDEKTRQDLEDKLKFNNVILRYLIIRMDNAVTEPSCVLKEATRPPRRFQDQQR